jgi:predicted dehydrogenase
MNFGIIGYGYWGPNIVRNLLTIDGAKVLAIADTNPAARHRARRLYPGIEITADTEAVLRSPKIDAIAVISPVWTHYELAKAALENGKHVFVEKPFTSQSEQGKELIELAARKGLTIMVDHTFLFTGAVRKIMQLVDEGTLGKLYYYDSTRINLGLFQHDINVVWDLAPHDLSIMDYLFKQMPEAVVATGQSHLNGHEDIAFLTLYFPDQMIAHINVNWISPVKMRTTLIGGEKRMLVWNDLVPDEKLRVYDRGVDVTTNDVEEVYSRLVSYRTGDMWAPQLEQGEALRKELAYFIECAQNGRRPINDGEAGLRVVKMLEAASRSLEKRGEMVPCC